jgi:putative DNA primase/helicase
MVIVSPCVGKQAMTITEILQLFPSAKRTGSGYQAKCPAHDDDKASLTISQGDDGHILLYCHARCDTTKICKTLGIEVKDLFADKPKAKNVSRKIVAVYPYHDKDGRYLYESVRYEPKDFMARVKQADGKYVWNIKGIQRVLYRLPKLLAYEGDGWIFIVEGEKDAGRLEKEGLEATTNVFGASAWEPEYSDSLVGFNVAIIPDNDKAGWEHVLEVAHTLVGKAQRIKIVPLPGVPLKGDVSDYLNAGHTADDLLRLVDAAMDWSPESGLKSPFEQEPDHRPSESVNKSANLPTYEGSSIDLPANNEVKPLTLVSTAMSEVVSTPIEWLWQGRFPLGMLSLLVGYPGKGKSFVSLDMAARVSRGAPWPDDTDAYQRPGLVYLMNFEDDLARAIRPRLDACGADAARIHAFEGIRTGDKVEKFFAVQSHMALLDGFWKDHPELRMVIIDPLTSALGDGDQNSNADIRRAMTALNAFAERTGVAVIGISHFAKRSDVSAMYKVMGSVAFTAVARAVWCVHQDEAQEGEPEPVRKLLFEKSNYSAVKTGLSFTIDGGVRWTDEVIYQTATEALNGSNKKSDKRQDAEQVILNILASGLEKHADDLTDEVLAMGVAERTYIRARGDLKARGLVGRRKDGTEGGWFWFKSEKLVQNDPL